MRWQELFADLEAQVRSMEAADLDSEIADRTRGEVAQVRLVNRLIAGQAGPVALQVWGTGALRGVLERVGRDWMLVRAEASGLHGNDTLVPLEAVTAVLDLPQAAVANAGVDPVQSRMGLASALRAVARDRSVVLLRLRDGAGYVGTPDRVGADFVDVAIHEGDVAPRAGSVRGRVTVPFTALGLVQRSPSGWG